jgi:hypothetical protein
LGVCSVAGVYTSGSLQAKAFDALLSCLFKVRRESLVPDVGLHVYRVVQGIQIAISTVSAGTAICPQIIKVSIHPAPQFTIIGIQFRDQGEAL